jgi:hypothetical protein
MPKESCRVTFKYPGCRIQLERGSPQALSFKRGVTRGEGVHREREKGGRKGGVSMESGRELPHQLNLFQSDVPFD